MRDIYTDEQLVTDKRPVPARFIYITTTAGYDKLIQLTKHQDILYMLNGFKEAVHHSYGAAVMFRAGLFHTFINLPEENTPWYKAMQSLFKNFLFFKTPKANIPLEYVRKDRPVLTEEQMKRVYISHTVNAEVLREGIKHTPSTASYLAGGYNIEWFGGSGKLDKLMDDIL